jgi:hypothetical protein
VIFNANATTQISFNGNQGTVILGTGVTVTGNVITFAPDTGFVAFRRGGTLSGNAGTAALPLQQISLGGNSTITGSAETRLPAGGSSLAVLRISPPPVPLVL